MKNTIKLLAAAAVWMSGHAAWAQADPGVSLQVTAFPPASVTLSQRYATRVAYRVTAINNTTNSLNKATFRGTTVVTGGLAGAAAVFEAGPIATENGTVACTLPSATVIECTVDSRSISTTASGFGSIAPGVPVTFWVSALVPATGTNLAMTPFFKGVEGNGSPNSCCGLTLAALNTPLTEPPVAGNTDPNLAYLKQLFSFVPPTGAGRKYFTGDEFPTSVDPWTTTIEMASGVTIVAPLGVNGGNVPFTTVATSEFEEPQSCAAVNRSSSTNNGCNVSLVTVPGSYAPFMTVILRQHPSIIRKGSTIDQWRPAYNHTPEVTNSAYLPIPYCKDTTAGGPTPGNPCIEDNGCREYSNKTVPAVPKSLWGVFECRIRAVNNGGFKILG